MYQLLELNFNKPPISLSMRKNLRKGNKKICEQKKIESFPDFPIIMKIDDEKLSFYFDLFKILLIKEKFMNELNF